MTRLDLILARVKRGVEEVTIDAEGYTDDQVKRIVSEAKRLGLTPSYDGRFILIREL